MNKVMSLSLPRFEFYLKDLQTNEWKAVSAELDPGSDLTNLPASMAKLFHVDLSREQLVILKTVGSEIRGYVVNMEMSFGGLQFVSPIIFRESDVPPLLGRYPLSQYFNIYYDNERNVVYLIPISYPIPSLVNLRLMLSKLFRVEW